MVETTTEDLQRKIIELSGAIRLSRPVALLESCLTEVPVVVGWLRPVVLSRRVC